MSHIPIPSSLFRAQFQVPQHKPHPKSKFSSDEDDRLRRLVAQFGESNWPAIAEQMPHRNTRQCKERWVNYLSPAVCIKPWTSEEDALLEQKVKELGPKWVRISQSFPQRTDSNVKNRWLVLSRRSRKEQQSSLALANVLKHASKTENGPKFVRAVPSIPPLTTARITMPQAAFPFLSAEKPRQN